MLALRLAFSSGAPCAALEPRSPQLQMRPAFEGVVGLCCKLLRWCSTAAWPKRLALPSSRSPSTVCGLIQPTVSSESRTRARKRGFSFSSPSLTPSSSNSTSSPGFASLMASLPMRGPLRNVAGSTTVYRAAISQEPGCRRGCRRGALALVPGAASRAIQPGSPAGEGRAKATLDWPSSCCTSRRITFSPASTEPVFCWRSGPLYKLTPCRPTV
mmetsp:Transcript_317/g.771  ORF Transcript_317/g.771 Transcript_317/m.771 type:complete len:214 (+) Transcript_317:554-1195(+)